MHSTRYSGHFTPADTVTVAALNISVSSVARSTPQASAHPVTSNVLLRPETDQLLQILRSKPVTPVKVDRLDFLLHGYPDSLKHFLVSGFSCGFRICFVGERHSLESPNLKSALEQPQIVISKIHKEREAGRIAGPFALPPFPNFRYSPLGIVPKKDPSEFRLIHHLSYPNGSSVNDSIPEECCSVRYASIDDAIFVIKQTGAGCFMAKTDIKSAFRIIPIHPSDYSLLGMKWQDMYYFDRCLPMGCSSSCAIFEAFSTALEWLALNRFEASGYFIFKMIFCLLLTAEKNVRRIYLIFLTCASISGYPQHRKKLSDLIPLYNSRVLHLTL